MKTPLLSIPSFLLSLTLVALSSAGLHAAVLFEDFNAYTDGASFPPALPPDGSPTWVASGNSGSGVTRTTSTTVESAFSAVQDGSGFLLTDTSTSSGASSGIETTLTTAQASAFTASFDYKVLSGSLAPQLRLWDADGAASNGVFFRLGTLTEGKYYIGNQTNAGVTNLFEISVDTWYHVELTVNPTTSKYVVSLTSVAGTVIYTSGELSFRGSATAIDTVTFIHNGAGTATGSWAVDNVSLPLTAIPEPSTYALFLGGLLFALTGMRRRCRKD